MKFVERHLIGDRDQADDHRAHLAQNRSQNQAFEGDCLNHLSRLSIGEHAIRVLIQNLGKDLQEQTNSARRRLLKVISYTLAQNARLRS